MQNSKKKLTEICKNIASKALQEPGTLVECMRPGRWEHVGLTLGKVYEVITIPSYIESNGRLSLDGVRDIIPHATRFRKAK